MQKTESNKNIYLKLYLQFLEMLLEIAFFLKKKKKREIGHCVSGLLILYKIRLKSNLFSTKRKSEHTTEQTSGSKC